MGVINPIATDRIRYTLIHDGWGSQVVLEPKGWDENQLEYSRNTNYSGIIANMSNSMTFYNEGAEYIRDVKSIYGINAKIVCTKDERNPETDVWTRTYNGIIDLTTFVDENDSVTVKFNASGLQEIIKNRQDKETEIERKETMDGLEMEDVENVLSYLNMKNRKIFLLSKLNAPKETLGTYGGFYSAGDVGLYAAPALDAYINSDQEYLQSVYRSAHDVFNGDTLNLTPFFRGDQIPESEQFFYFNNDRQKALQITASFSFSFSYNGLIFNTTRVKVSIAKYKYNKQTQEAEYDSMVSDIGNFFFDGSTGTIEGCYDNTGIPVYAELEERDCLMLLFTFPTDGSNVTQGNNYSFYIKEINLKIESESEYPDTLSKCIMARPLIERLLKIISGKSDILVSKSLGSKGRSNENLGENSGGLTAFAHGMWLRQFSKKGQDNSEISDNNNNDDDANRYKPFKTSLKKVMAFFDAVWGLTLGIEQEGLRQKVLIEPISYFYNLNTTIRLGKVSNIKRSVAKEYYYSGAEVGFSKPDGDRLYEEAMGLDEYNIKSDFTTCIKVVKNDFKKVSPLRTDSYGAEFARRKPYGSFPTEDTNYDTDVFGFDVKKRPIRFRGSYELRTWQDDFDEAPTGIYSPDTAHNLRFSPMNILKRQSQYLSGLKDYPLEKVRFSSSTANTNLETKKDGVVLKENGNLENGNLDRPRWIPEYIEFEKNVDFEINQKINGTTNANGEVINNFYGCVEFENEDGQLEYGFIISVKPNGQGQWKLLKSNR